MNKIGVILEGFKSDVNNAVDSAISVRADGIQFYGGFGPLDTDKLTPLEKSLFEDKLKENNLEVSAICGDLGGHGFARKNEHEYRIEKTYRMMKWAEELNCSVMTTHIGVIPSIANEQRKNIAQACKELNKRAQTTGTYIAIETGPETISTLKGFLEEIDCEYIAVNYDPANLVMVTGEDPIDGVYQLKDKIVHTHVKDGIMKKQADPAFVYDYFAEGGIEDIRLSDYFEETPLLEGDVNIPEWLNALYEINYKGYLTIERETLKHKNPYIEIENCVNIIKELKKRVN